MLHDILQTIQNPCRFFFIVKRQIPTVRHFVISSGKSFPANRFIKLHYRQQQHRIGDPCGI